jgi:hypothetical protein
MFRLVDYGEGRQIQKKSLNTVDKIDENMPIKSFFFPKEALQGEDLPSHVTWSDLKFDCIKVVHPRTLKLKEIYNVADEDLEIKEGLILINKVEVDGYLGIVYSTTVLPDRSLDETIEYSFILQDKVVKSLNFAFHLFRPDVVIQNVPRKIEFNSVSGDVSPKILVRNFGEGTAIVDIETTPESELQKHRPQFIENFLQDFANGVKTSIAQLKKDFKEYDSLLNELEIFLVNPVKFEKESLKKFEKFEDKIISAFEENEEFAEVLVETFAEIFLRSREFSNVYQFVLDYINSIGKEKILLRDPFNVVKLSREPATLRVKIKCIDLLKQIRTPMTLPDITVVANQSSEIGLFKLFEWGEKKR